MNKKGPLWAITVILTLIVAFSIAAGDTIAVLAAERATETVANKRPTKPRPTTDIPETTEPPVETTEPPSTTEPPPETTEPPVETTEPPSTTEPPPETTEPPVVTTEPPPSTTEPPATTEPPVVTTQAPDPTTPPPPTKPTDDDGKETPPPTHGPKWTPGFLRNPNSSMPVSGYGPRDETPTIFGKPIDRRATTGMLIGILIMTLAVALILAIYWVFSDPKVRKLISRK